MWKNVFLESCILSALIFGGIYLNANLLKKEISLAQENFQNQPTQINSWLHISGSPLSKDHISGISTRVKTMPSISGNPQSSLTSGK